LHGTLDAQRESDRILLTRFAPPGVLVNAAGQVLQFHGATGAFLELPAGRASFDLLKMAREGLMLPLRTALQQARRGGQPVVIERVPFQQDGATRYITLHVIPLLNVKERAYLVLFEPADERGGRRAAAQAPAKALPEREATRRRRALESELAETRDYLQSMQEQHEAAREELQASAEELQSANEELQSINEELETSKEELESSNEELTTVNEEMASRNEEMGRLNADLNNIRSACRCRCCCWGATLRCGASRRARRKFSTCWPATWAASSAACATPSTAPIWTRCWRKWSRR